MFTSSSFTFHVTGNSNKYCHRSNHYKKISSLECETAIIVKITINPDNQNTMEVMFKQRAIKPNLRAEEISPLLSASLAYKQIDKSFSPK